MLICLNLYLSDRQHIYQYTPMHQCSHTSHQMHLHTIVDAFAFCLSCLRYEPDIFFPQKYIKTQSTLLSGVMYYASKTIINIYSDL